MKVVNSLKSLRHRGQQIVRRKKGKKGKSIKIRLYVISKNNPKFKARQG